MAADVAGVVQGLLLKDPLERMALAQALDASEAVAALVAHVPMSAGNGDDDDESPRHAFARSGKLESSGADDVPALRVSNGSWRDTQVNFCGSGAAKTAREALGGDVDDPEELVRALAALEEERRGAPAGTSAALDALESELRLRIHALRVDCAAMLDDLFAAESDGDGGHAGVLAGQSAFDQMSSQRVLDNPQAQEAATPESVGDDDEVDDIVQDDGDSPRSSIASCGGPGAAASAFEEALEVATTLGVNTEASEECVARKRGMLSLRVMWGGAARFCMLPVSMGFDSLVAEISRRFGLASSAALPQLSWREAEESFKLASQANWEECLQRRGLVAQPGRLELRVDTDAPPPQRAPRRAVMARAAMVAARRAMQDALETRAIQGAATPSGMGATARPGLFTWRVAPGRPQDRLPTARRSVGAARPQDRLLARCPSRGLDASAAAAEARFNAALTVASLSAGEGLDPLEESEGEVSLRLRKDTVRCLGGEAAAARCGPAPAGPGPAGGAAAAAFRTQGRYHYFYYYY